MKEPICCCSGVSGEIAIQLELSTSNGQDSFSTYKLSTSKESMNHRRKWTVCWKIKKDVIEDQQNGALILKVPGQNIILNKIRKVFAIYKADFDLWLVNKLQAKTKIALTLEILIQFQLIEDSNLSSKGMKKILKKK